MENKGTAIFNKISNIGTSDADDAGALLTKATISGAAVGGAFGIYYGWSRKKNILVMCVIGGIVGAIVTRIVMPKSN